MQILKKTESINWAIEALDDMPGIGRKVRTNFSGNWCGNGALSK